MPLPQIAVEIAAPPSAMAASAANEAAGGAEARRTLIASCGRAAATAECVIARADSQAAVLALVFWRGAGHVRIEVGLPARSAPWAIRELEFAVRDPALEKWRTIGFAVGSLASEALAAQQRGDGNGPRSGSSGEADTGAEIGVPPEHRDESGRETADADTAKPGGEKGAASRPSTESATKSVAPPEKPPPAPVESKDVAAGGRDSANGTRAGAGDRASRRWGIGAGAVLGPGLASVRGGGFLRVSRLFAGPFATAALAYSVDAESSRGVSAKRLALSLGGGYEFALGGEFALDLRAELVAENLAARVEEPVSGRTDDQSRWVAAFDAGVELFRYVAGPVGVVVGVEGTIRTNRTDVQVRNSTLATAPVADALALVGVRVVLR